MLVCIKRWLEQVTPEGFLPVMLSRRLGWYVAAKRHETDCREVPFE